MMRKAIKKSGKTILAYELGTDDDKLQSFMQRGEIKKISENEYEIFSQEAINGKGQKAKTGDYIKIDSAQKPYPNDREFFQKNHKKISDDNEYEQIPKPVYIWQADDSMCDEVQFLLQNKGLIIEEGNNDKYFTAPLWGTTLSAKRNAYLVFYKIKRASDGEIIDIDFNFVENEEFKKTYVILEN